MGAASCRSPQQLRRTDPRGFLRPLSRGRDTISGIVPHAPHTQRACRSPRAGLHASRPREAAPRRPWEARASPGVRARADVFLVGACALGGCGSSAFGRGRGRDAVCYAASSLGKVRAGMTRGPR